MPSFLLIISHTNPHSGYQEINVLNASAKLGYKTYLVLPKDCEHYFADGSYKKMLDERVIVHYYDFIKIGKKYYPKNLLGIFKTLAPDVIWIHDFYSALVPASQYYQANKDCKIYFACHSDFSNTAKSRAGIFIYYKMFANRVVQRTKFAVAKYLSVVPASTTFLQERFGIEKDHIKLFPIGLDMETLHEDIDLTKQQNFIKKHQLEADFLVATGGRLNPSKQTEDVIKAFLKLGCSSCKLVIFGRFEVESYKEQILELIAGHPQIIYLGMLTNQEVNLLLSVVDVGVYPASQTVLWQRTMALGAILIAGKWVYYKNILFEQDVEYLIAPEEGVVLQSKGDKSEEIYQYLSEILHDEDKRKNMQQRAKQRAASFLDITKNLKEIVEATGAAIK